MPLEHHRAHIAGYSRQVRMTSEFWAGHVDPSTDGRPDGRAVNVSGAPETMPRFDLRTGRHARRHDERHERMKIDLDVVRGSCPMRDR
jgi:hypothetical protein